MERTRTETLLDSTFWVDYWLNHEVAKPTKEEIEKIKKVRDHILNNWQLALSVSLKHLILEDCEDLETTKNLHEYWLIINQELKKRGHETLNFDPWEVDIESKKKGLLVNPEKLVEKARKEGICPECNSKEHVISYGDKWKCKLHKKYWRKA